MTISERVTHQPPQERTRTNVERCFRLLREPIRTFLELLHACMVENTQMEHDRVEERAINTLSNA